MDESDSFAGESGDLASEIRDYLSGRDDLLKDDYGDHPLAGHCYVASEAYFHLTGGYDRWYVCRVSHEGTTHWFLEDRETGEIVDLTAEQFSTPVPYDERTRTGFMTTDPSERTQTVLDALE